MIDEHLHVVIARRLWAAIADGNADDVRDLLADEVVWRASGQNRVLAGDHHGPEGVLDFLATVGEFTDEFNSELRDIFYSERGAVISYHATARQADKKLVMDYLLLLTIEDGQIVAAWSVPLDQHANDGFWSG